MTAPAVSFVVIGLNEEAHLPDCFASLEAQGFARNEVEILYVDSGSSDGSREVARRAGVDQLVELSRDGASAARARNAGLRVLRAPYVQFVDGDTSLEPGWVTEGLRALDGDERLAGVEGLLREKSPELNVYHLVSELDWRRQPGEIPFVGGNGLYRVAALREAEGFDPRMSVGEEPELGARLRRRGWRLRLLDVPMGRHDLAMRSVRDYLGRAYRNGRSCGLVVRVTGGVGSGFWRERLWRTLGQAAALLAPLLAAVLLLPAAPGLGTGLAAAWLLGLLLLAVRKAGYARRRGLSPGRAIAYGLHTYLVKIPAALGILHALAEGLPDPLGRAPAKG